MIKTTPSPLVEIRRSGPGAKPKTFQGKRFGASFLGQRLRVAYKPKRNPRKPAGDVCVCLEFDFKERTPP
jgi:hypothetical protein